MGYYKSILNNVEGFISPNMSKDSIEDVFCKLADESGEFENLVFTYGVRKFTKRYRSEQKNDEFVENPLLTMIRVIDYCKSSYDASLDCCGEDDEINTIPAKEALEDAKKVLAYLENTLKV